MHAHPPLQGKELRLKQQHFFVSATIQDVVRRFRDGHGDFEDFPKKARPRVLCCAVCAHAAVRRSCASTCEPHAHAVSPTVWSHAQYYA